MKTSKVLFLIEYETVLSQLKQNAHNKWCNIMNFWAHLQHYLDMTMTL